MLFLAACAALLLDRVGVVAHCGTEAISASEEDCFGSMRGDATFLLLSLLLASDSESGFGRGDGLKES